VSPDPRPGPRRGEVWIVDFGEPIGREQAYRRPAVILSSDRLNASRAGLVVVVPITRTRRGLPSHIEIERGESGLSETSYAKSEDVKSISSDRLARRLGRVSPSDLDEIDRSVRLILEH